MVRCLCFDSEVFILKVHFDGCIVDYDLSYLVSTGVAKQYSCGLRRVDSQSRCMEPVGNKVNLILKL